MKEIITKDGTKLYYTKNKVLSINGQYNAYDFYLEVKNPQSFVGTRKGVKNIKTSKFEDLFTAGGSLKKQVPNVKEPTEETTKKIREILSRTVGEEETEDKTNHVLITPGLEKTKFCENCVYLNSDEYELWTVFQFTIKRKDNSESINKQLGDYLEKTDEWELVGYEISSKKVGESIKIRLRLNVNASQKVSVNQVIEYLKKNEKWNISDVKLPKKGLKKEQENEEKSSKKHRKIRRKK